MPLGAKPLVSSKVKNIYNVKKYANQSEESSVNISEANIIHTIYLQINN